MERPILGASLVPWSDAGRPAHIGDPDPEASMANNHAECTVVVSQDPLRVLVIDACMLTPDQAGQLAEAGLDTLAVHESGSLEARLLERLTHELKPAATAEEDDAADKDIIVTGTLIRGTAAVGSQTISVDSRAILEKGASSTNELLGVIPQIANAFNAFGLAGGE